MVVICVLISCDSGCTSCSGGSSYSSSGSGSGGSSYSSSGSCYGYACINWMEVVVERSGGSSGL